MTQTHHHLPWVLAERNQRYETGINSIPRRRVIERREWEDLELNAEDLVVGDRLQLYEEIQGSKYLSVHFKGNRVVFTATHYVGHIPLNDHIAVNVVPRFGISSLTRLLRVSRHSPIPIERFTRAYSIGKEKLPSIFDELVAMFIQAIELVCHYGLLPTYKCKKEDTSFPRGRIIIGETIKRYHARGTKYKATVENYERSYDNAPNQLLKYTLWLLEKRLTAGTQRKGIARLRTLINRYFRAFQYVTLDKNRRFLSNPFILETNRIPTVRAYYIQALQLAVLLIQNESLDLSKKDGIIIAPTMLVDLQDGFESYLRNSLNENLKSIIPSIEVIDGNIDQPTGGKKHLFDDSKEHKATPDIIIRENNQDKDEDELKISVLVEVKYKERVSREDINQTISYGVSYRCPILILAHVKKPTDPPHLNLEGRIGNIVLYRYAYDLAGDMELEERVFSETIKKLIKESKVKSYLHGE